jgi:hypothetical protein
VVKQGAALAGILVLAGCPAKTAEQIDAAVAQQDAAQPAPAEAAAKTKREAPPLREATREDAERALANLESWTRAGAADPKNAWALAHGIVGFGKELKTPDGRSAPDVIVGDYLDKREDGFYFHLHAEGTPVEPHADLMIKTLLESGVPPDRAFKTKVGKVTLAQIVEDAEKRFDFPSDESGWRNYAWSAYALMLANKDSGQLDTEKGPVPLAALAEKTVARLEVEQQFLVPLLGHPEALEKRRQGIYAHHCGGLHFVQAAVLGASIAKMPALTERVKKQLELVFFRWDAERRIYKEALWNEPKYRWLLLVQELKFYGHVLETFALAKDYGVFEPDEAQSLKLRQIAGDLVETSSWLADAYKKEAMQQMPPQTQYDLIGDGCHAIRGLRRGLVAFFAPRS